MFPAEFMRFFLSQRTWLTWNWLIFRMTTFTLFFFGNCISTYKLNDKIYSNSTRTHTHPLSYELLFLLRAISRRYCKYLHSIRTASNEWLDVLCYGFSSNSSIKNTDSTYKTKWKLMANENVGLRLRSDLKRIIRNFLLILLLFRCVHALFLCKQSPMQVSRFSAI